MKKHLSIILLSVVVAAQLLWLACSYHARYEELQTSPTLRVHCDALDPRDILRGDYVRFSCNFNLPITDPLFADLLYWDKEYKPEPSDEEQKVRVWVMGKGISVEVPSEEIQGIPARAATRSDAIKVSYDGYGPLDNLAGYWRTGADGSSTLVRVVRIGNDLDVPRAGEVRTVMSGYVSERVVEEDGKYRAVGMVRLSICASELNRRTSFRFYVPEGAGEPIRAWMEGHRAGKHTPDQTFPSDYIRTSVEFVCRGRNGLIVKQLYLNDIPWVEAINMMRAGTFPLLKEPVVRH